jgi:uncharacterized protein
MIALYWILVLVMLVGVIGAVVPGIPGLGLIAIAIAIWGLTAGFSGLWIPFTVAIVALVFTTGLDFLATYWGAKKAGASRWGVIGAMVGLVLGVFGLLPALPLGGPLLGLLIGPLLGAMVGEFLYRRDLMLAIKAAIGILVGNLVGVVIHVLLAIATVIVFLVTTLPTVY